MLLNNMHKTTSLKMKINLLSSSLTSMAEILVRIGFRVPGLLWEIGPFPFSRGTGAVVDEGKGIPAETIIFVCGWLMTER